MKFLVIQQKMIGDVLTCSLLCENIKRWNPKAVVHFVANDFTLPVLENHPYIDKIVVFEKRYQSDLIAFFRFLWSVRSEDYDYVLDAYGKIESMLITLFAKARVKIGYVKAYNAFIYDKRELRSTTPKNHPMAVIDRIFLLKSIFPSDFQYTYTPKIYLSTEEITEAKTDLNVELSTGMPLIMVAITGSSETKTYPMPYMAELLDIIAANGCRMVLNYLPKQQDLVNRCLAYVQPKTLEVISKTTPQSLRNFMQWSYHCKAIIGNEGGTINMAKALGKPTYAIFSPAIRLEGWHQSQDPKHQAVHISQFINGDKKNLNNREAYNAFQPQYFLKDFTDFIYRWCV